MIKEARFEIHYLNYIPFYMTRKVEEDLQEMGCTYRRTEEDQNPIEIYD